MTLGKVVVGVDESRGARDAVAWTAQLALESDTEVVVVHAAPLEEDRPVPMQELDDLCETLHRAGIAYRCMVVGPSDPRVALAKIADEEDAELIVVGSSEESAFVELVKGGVGLDLIHHSGRTVAIVHADPRTDTDVTTSVTAADS